MNIIIKNDNFNIGQGQDEIDNKSFTIFFDSYNEALIKSIAKTKIILGATTTEKYKTLSFKAISVQRFSDFQKELVRENKSLKMPYNLALKMTYNLVTQLKYLITHYSQTFLGYSLENLIVIDKHKFVYLCNDFLLNIKNGNDYNDNNNDNDNVLISYPFTCDDFFMAPELYCIKEIPSFVNYKVSYFSLGYLILYTLIGDNIDSDREDLQEKDKIKNHLDSLIIKNTKLYWLLERCLVEEPTNRSILFI
jgi:hypothetical protein